jgi:hypothetical protein
VNYIQAVFRLHVGNASTKRDNEQAIAYIGTNEMLLTRLLAICSDNNCIGHSPRRAVLLEQSLGNRDHVPGPEKQVGFKQALFENVAKLDLEHFRLVLALAE